MRVAQTLLMLVLLGLGGCQSGVAPVVVESEPPSLGESTQRVVITYSIAQGMAKSYGMSGRATQSDLLTLVGYDHVALLALRDHLASPSWNSLANAARAISALMDYTTTMDARAPASPSSRAAAR